MKESENVKLTKEQEVLIFEINDHTINDVIYRVRSAFLGHTDAKECLQNLMLRRLESESSVKLKSRE